LFHRIRPRSWRRLRSAREAGEAVHRIGREAGEARQAHEKQEKPLPEESAPRDLGRTIEDPTTENN